ncbi:NAD-dependent epimerase/dehydratase family protein [Flavobacterium dankookense]|uniref:Nucleoside-diphosphate-sugar epimerase n=1 Tax=Flavobacterium dankookense TaxID=706186 RepID=A0A4R6Q882_9FLAO|nr:NAD-dependent epimerase/dehydratase family protein [Flavobacterium dankookense]TDP58764.1 nucleoside-diphosphate-sugar epimerase [Flavobacterium dankookense]
MILVTGGTGLVGAHLLLLLAENEETIVAIYRNPKKIEKTKTLFAHYQKPALFSKINWIEADILDISSLEIAFKNIKYVYHCAAHISFNPKDENLLRKVNIEGTANIVNFCIDKKIEKLCHVSSIAALGDLKETETILTEEIEWNPEIAHSDYAITKYGAEMEVWRGQQEGLQVVIVNPGVIFGSMLWTDGSGAFFTKIKKGFPFYTKGSTGFVGVFDVVKAMHLLMNSDVSGERFSLVSENVSFEEIIFKIADKLKVKKPTFEVKPWMTSLAWRLDWLVAAVFRTKRKITKYSANSLHSNEIIANEKIKNPEISGLNFEFQSIDSVLNEIILLSKKS